MGEQYATVVEQLHKSAHPGVNTRTVDPALPVNYLLANQAAPLERVMSNSFGFGVLELRRLVLGRARASAVPLSGCIEGIGLPGPGIEGWSAAAAILGGRTPWVSAPTVLPLPEVLPPAERRRTGAVGTDARHGAGSHPPRGRGGRGPGGRVQLLRGRRGELSRDLRGARLLGTAALADPLH